MKTHKPSHESQENMAIHNQWQEDLKKYMPCKPQYNNSSYYIPSNDINDFVTMQGSNFSLPLGPYLYGPNPTGFEHLHHGRPMDTQHQPQTATTSFHGSNITRRSAFDQLMSTLVEQSIETIPRIGNKVPLGRYDFKADQMLQGVNVLVKSQVTGDVFKDGIIVAYSTHDINYGPRFTVSSRYFLMYPYTYQLLTIIFTHLLSELTYLYELLIY